MTAAFATGILYVPVRLNLPSPLPPALLDVLHLYASVAGAAILVGKVVGRRRAGGQAVTDSRGRYVTTALAALLALSFVTGALAVLPLGSRSHAAAVNAHLLTSTWAAVPVTLHVILSRRLLRWVLGRREALIGLTAMAAPAIVLLPITALALSDASAAGVSGRWSEAQLTGISLEALAGLPDGRLLAGGDGLYLGGGGRWHEVGLPSGSADSDRLVELGIRPPSVTTPASSSGEHGSHAAAPLAGGVTTILVTEAGGHVFVGTDEGLYYSPWPEGPYLRLDFPGGGVRALAGDSRNPYVLWVAPVAGAGPYLTVDGGHSWSRLSAGLARPDQVKTLAWSGDTVFASDLAGVERWDGDHWTRVVPMPLVAALAPDGRGGVYALAHQAGVYRLDGTDAVSLASGPHQHGGVTHQYLLAAGGGLAAAADGGGRVSVARKAGGWVPAGSISDANALAVTGDRMYALTANGVRAQQAGPARSPSVPALLMVAAVAVAAAALALLALDGRAFAGAATRPKRGARAGDANLGA